MALPRWPHKRDPREAERAEHAASIISAYPHVFDASATLREMQGGPMRIQLSADAHPFAVTAPRTIPYCWRWDIKDQLEDLLAKDIIVQSPHDAISSMDAGARWFTTFDAKMGYFQIKIAEEDQDLTCFITPWGRYKLKRAVMGLLSSGDEYNRQGDQVLGDIPPAAQPLRDLLKPWNEWCWTPQHDVAFEKTKEALIAPPILAHFDASLPTMLQTDTSKLHGMGFVFLQQHGEAWKFIQCGSRFLTDAETRYAVIEVEMAAVLWAVRKCCVYLAGLPYFDQVVDRRPLVPILNSKHIGEVENPRLPRMKMKLRIFTFAAGWQSGKCHSMPDALSRSKVQSLVEDNDVLDDADPLHAALVLSLLATCEEGISLCNDTLQCLHDAHQGVDRTKRRARQTIYWPGNDRGVENTVKSCSRCRELL
ncbi:uncharacterized protein [Palaemon carinicauda]|uniref:uncharacterized protein n=1 Tax=Palaemon carinicauda TaxID=392227 RepID=UPI0035B584CB